jgi:hypothetical protein
MPSIKRTFLVVCLTVASAIVALGCSNSSGATSSITKAQLLKQGDAICGKADDIEYEESVEYEEKHKKELKGKSRDFIFTKIMLEVGFPSILTEKEELEALGTPPGDEKQLEKIFVGIEKAVKLARKEPRSANDPDGPFEGVDKLAHRYGFRSCDELA